MKRTVNWMMGVSFLVLALPFSSNYKLDNYGFGGGGLDNSTSSNYKMNAILGELNSSKMAGSNYDFGPGLEFSALGNVPVAPTLVNDGSYYNKLKLTLDSSGNPSDAVFAIAISSDDFVTTYYVQSDNSIGLNLGSEDWQTYSAWGGASGMYIVGLDTNTTYKVKAKVSQGNYTETDWGPTASASTVGPSVTFDIDVSSSDSETDPPYVLALGDLTPGSVTTGTDKLWVDLDTNGEGGGYVYVYGANGGLSSTSTSYTISSVSDNLGNLSEGFGIRSDTLAEGSGGPLTAVSPYDVAGDSVGAVSTSTQTIINSSAAPVTSGRASILVKAKVQTTTPAASDYQEVITLIASGTF